MPAHHFTRVLDFLDDWLPTPARLLLVLAVLAMGLCVAGTTWPPLSTSSAPTGAVAITPDDPAAPTVAPVQGLGR